MTNANKKKHKKHEKFDDNQIQKFNLNIFMSKNVTLLNLNKFFIETRQKKNMTHVICFYKQKFNNDDAIYKESRIQIDKIIHVSRLN